jgi:hypothetical protein
LEDKGPVEASDCDADPLAVGVVGPTLDEWLHGGCGKEESLGSAAVDRLSMKGDRAQLPCEGQGANRQRQAGIEPSRLEQADAWELGRNWDQGSRNTEADFSACAMLDASEPKLGCQAACCAMDVLERNCRFASRTTRSIVGQARGAQEKDVIEALCVGMRLRCIVFRRSLSV